MDFLCSQDLKSKGSKNLSFEVRMEEWKVKIEVKSTVCRLLLHDTYLNKIVKCF